MKRSGKVVYLVEDDPLVREDICLALESADIQVCSFSSAGEYLAYVRSDMCACMVLELDLRDGSALELQRQLAADASLPIIFISRNTNISATVCAMKAGAIEFLTMPVDESALLAAVQNALVLDLKLRHRRDCKARLQQRLFSLTPRQREVFPLVIGGLLNKQAAAILDISEVTLQIHRSQIMKKMAADSLAELVRMAVTLRIPHWRPELGNK